tara:strand:- start:2976 stop:5954 length:2979 start_codon:yes stop_codon:yes gene_type:complete
MLATGMKPRLEGQFRRKNHYVALLCVDVYPIRDGFPYGLRLETGGQMKRLVILCLVFVGCASESRMPSVVEGALKIREIPEKNLSLSGQWAFCPNALLPGHDFASEMPGHCSFQTIPDSWTRYPAPWGMKGTGVATYRMILEIPEDLSADLALYMPFQGTAYELWVNGEVLARNGTVARNPAKRQAAMLPQMVRLPDAPVIELVLHISNGHDKSGGMWNAPLLGPAQSIEDYVHRTVILDSLMTGMLLLATGFSFALFLLNTQDRASLFFGFFALFAMLRQISTNSHIILHLMPDFPFGVYYRLEFLGILLSPAAFLHSLNHLFPGTMHRFALRGLTAIFVFFALIVIFLPPLLFTNIVPLNHAFLVATMAVAARSIYLGRQEQKLNALLIGAGFIALSFFVIHDILVELNLLQSPYLVSFGLLLFLLAHVAALAHRAARERQEKARISASLQSAQILSNVAWSLIGCDSPASITVNLFGSLKHTFGLQKLGLYLPEIRTLYTAPISSADESRGISREVLFAHRTPGLAAACVREESDPELRWPADFQDRSLCVPVQEGDELRAILFFQRFTNEPYKESTRELLQGLTPYVVLALRNASMVSDLREAHHTAYRQQEFQRIVLSVLGHDLRGPLATSYSLLDDLSHNREALKGAELDLLRGGIRDSMDLLQRLLEWARASTPSGHLSLHCDVSSVLKTVQKDISLRAIQKKVELDLVLPPKMSAAIEPDSLEVVLRNIAMNAIKFTPASGKVHIYAEQGPTEVQIHIEDTGIGMDAKEARQLLDPERRVQPRSGTDGEKGAGLGMYLSQLLLAATGGYITVETESAKGTRFTVHLPATGETQVKSESDQREPDQIHSDSDPIAFSGAETLRILHVEDSDLLAMLVARLLRKGPFELQRARNGAEALALLNQNRYNLVLSDVELEGDRALVWASTYKNGAGASAPPFVGVTAHDYEAVEKYIQDGILDGYLQKPFNRKQLMDTIARFASAPSSS